MDNQHATEASDDAVAKGMTSELASLDIRVLEELIGPPRKKTLTKSFLSSCCNSDESSPKGERHIQSTLESLLVELTTPAVKADKKQQFDLYYQIGDLYRTKLHQPHLAIQYYQNMLECSQELSEDTKQKAIAYNMLGITYDMLGLQQEALENDERVLAIYKAEAAKTDICVAYKNLASSLALSDKVVDGKTTYEAALEAAVETGSKTEQMDICCRLGDLYRVQLHDPQVSQKYYTEMLALAREAARTDWEMMAYNRLGQAQIKMGDYKAGLEYRQMYLRMSKDAENTKEQIRAHTQVGNAYRRLGNIDKATFHFDTALQMAEQTGYPYEQMDVYFWMGEMHREQLRSPQTPIQYYKQYRALARQLMDKEEEGLAYNRLGQAHAEMREYETALEWDQKYLKMCQEAGDKKRLIIAHADMANAYRGLGKVEQATSHFNTALQVAQEIGYQQGQMHVCYCMGDMHREQLRSPRTAIQYYEQCLMLARQGADKAQELVACNRLGAAYVGLGEHDAALEWHQKDLEVGKELEDKTAQIRAHKNIATSYKALGKKDQARSHYQSALVIAMETGNKQQQEDINKKLNILNNRCSVQ